MLDTSSLVDIKMINDIINLMLTSSMIEWRNNTIVIISSVIPGK